MDGTTLFLAFFCPKLKYNMLVIQQAFERFKIPKVWSLNQLKKETEKKEGGETPWAGFGQLLAQPALRMSTHVEKLLGQDQPAHGGVKPLAAGARMSSLLEKLKKVGGGGECPPRDSNSRPPLRCNARCHFAAARVLNKTG